MSGTGQHQVSVIDEEEGAAADGGDDDDDGHWKKVEAGSGPAVPRLMSYHSPPHCPTL